MTKTRASVNSLVIACAHLGMSERILKVLKVYQKYYKADVYHLGQLVTIDEKKMMEWRLNKIRTLEKIKKEFDEHEWKDSKHAETLEDTKKRISLLLAAQDNRIDTLNRHFGEVSFVVNNEQYFESDAFLGAKVVDTDVTLSSHIRLESLSANGDKVSSNPITAKSFNFFRQKGGSFVVPHPNPVIEPFAREGLNQSFQYFTTGCLYETVAPKRASEYFKAAQAPAAILVMVDSENGEFHTKRVRFDYFRDAKTHRDEPAILDDGLLFTANGVIELGDEEKGAIITDSHARWEHKGVLAAFKAFLPMHHGEFLCHAGDVADWPSVSRHLQSKPLYKEGVRFNDDVNSFFGYLKAIGDFAFLKRRVVSDSNHDTNWVDNYVAAHPELKGTCDWATLVKRAPDWDIMGRGPGENKTTYFGNLAIRHGDKEGGVRDGYKKFVRYICGHWHAWREYGDAGSMGAACGLGPAFLENGVTAWLSTFTSLTKYRGQARFNTKIVLHNEAKRTSRFAYRNKIYEVGF